MKKESTFKKAEAAREVHKELGSSSLLFSGFLLPSSPCLAFAVIGFLIDIFDFSPKVCLPFQFASGGVFAVCALIGYVPHLNGVLLPVLIVGAVIYIVGTANFYNFMDGVNGIAGITGIVGFGLLGFYVQITGLILS